MTNEIMTSEKLRKYVMRSFGVDIRDLEKKGLTHDEEILLCKIRETRRLADLHRGEKKKPSEDFEIDEELSELCSEAWK